MKGIIGFSKVDIIITNREFMDWYNNVHNADDPRDINDFEYPYNGEDVPNVIEKYIAYRFNLDTYNTNIALKERDNIEFPQRVRFLARSMIEFKNEKEFNLYKISEPSSYSELSKIEDNPVYVNPDYGSC